MSDVVDNVFIYTAPERCMGCHSCELACAMSHSSYDFNSAVLAGVVLIPRNKVIAIKNQTTTAQCVQCEAPCLDACKSNCMTREAVGVIKIDEEKCIGCKLCFKACPYDSITMVEIPQEEPTDGKKKRKKLKAFKCDLCFDRIDVDGSLHSACVEACPTDAIIITRDNSYRIKSLSLCGY